MDSLLQDVRYALRQLRRRPVFAVVAAGSLAVGIGANTAIFSVANTLLLKPVPGVAEHDRLVEVGRSTQGRGFDTFAYPDYEDLASGVDAFDATAAYSWEVASFSLGNRGERVTTQFSTQGYFDLMGVHPAQGRFFVEEEDAPGAVPSTVVVSHRFWQDRLGGDPSVLGSTVYLNRNPFTVVGITPDDFRGHVIGFQPDVFLPMRAVPLMRGEDPGIFQARNSSWHMMVARLRPGATLEEADAQVKTVYGRLAEAYPDTNARRSGSVVSLGLVPGAGRTGVRAFVFALVGLVTLILLVTCANVAGMFIARAARREKEIAVRLALGSGRRRLVRQLLVEALAVFAVGGGAGAVVGVLASSSIPVNKLPLPVPVHVDLSPDWRVLAFALLATLSTGLVFGLLPALQATRLDLVQSLKDEGGRRGGRASRLRRVFVGGQVGLSLVLLMSAGLFLRSLQRAATVETGFDPRGAYLTALDLSLEGYDDEAEGRVFQQTVLDAVRGIPGVTDAALSVDLPLDLGSHGTAVFPEGWAEDDRVGVDFNIVSDGYFSALGIPLLSGRVFSRDDVAEGEAVAMVSRHFAEAVWPGEEALGRRIRFGGPDAALRTVVGVVEDVKNQLLTESPSPFVYVPLTQSYRSNTNVVVRAGGGINAVAPALRDAILAQDPSLSLNPVVSLERYTSLGVLPQRIAAGLTTVLGLLALLLSGLGVYGVVAFAVSQRTREIGLRMALGAGQRSVVGLILRGGLVLAAPGLVLGALAGVGFGYVLRSFLLGLSPTDPVTLLAVVGMLTVVVLLASVVPASRASSVQPTEALRAE